MSWEVTKAIIPMAGLGTRMAPYTNVVPKEFLPLGTTSVLQHAVDEIYLIPSINEIVYVISDDKIDLMRKFINFQHNVYYNSKLIHTKIHQTKSNGLLGAIREAVKFYENYLGTTNGLLISLPDMVLKKQHKSWKSPLLRAIEQYNCSHKSQLITQFKAGDLSSYGVVMEDDVVEKPQNQKDGNIVVGRYVVNIYDLINYLKIVDPADDFTKILKMLLQQQKLESFLLEQELRSEYLDTGTWNEYVKTFNQFT